MSSKNRMRMIHLLRWRGATGSGKRVGEVMRWSARYTPETLEDQIQDAKVTRRWMLALEYWLLLALTLAGFISVGLGLRTQYRRAQ